MREGQQGQIDDGTGQELATFFSFCHYFEAGSQAIHTGFTHRTENDLELLTLEPLLPKLGHRRVPRLPVWFIQTEQTGS